MRARAHTRTRIHICRRRSKLHGLTQRGAQVRQSAARRTGDRRLPPGSCACVLTNTRTHPCARTCSYVNTHVNTHQIRSSHAGAHAGRVLTDVARG
jgi:hypothetical protein